MVGRILDATRKLLIEEGLGALTTNHVAKAAGISVGSLYQYFPNKQAIVNGLMTHWLSEVRNATRALQATLVELSVDEAFTAWFGFIYGDWRNNAEDLRFVSEMSSAAKLFPELSDLDRSHGLEMADIIAGILKTIGSPKSEEELKRIGLYLYGLHNAFEEMIVRYPVDSDALYDLHAQVSRSVFVQALGSA
jgi:AcrR family transcriptional regulator